MPDAAAAPDHTVALATVICVSIIVFSAIVCITVILYKQLSKGQEITLGPQNKAFLLRLPTPFSAAEGATAAVARIHLDGAPPQTAPDAMRAESPDIIELSVLKL